MQDAASLVNEAVLAGGQQADELALGDDDAQAAQQGNISCDATEVRLKAMRIY
jgi:hypothetical protein